MARAAAFPALNAAGALRDELPVPPRTLVFRAALALHLAFVIALAAGAYLGRIPTSLPSLPHADWLGHALLIGLLAFFAEGAFPRRLPIASLLVLTAAGIEEMLQSLSPRRTASFADFAADAVGVAAFAWLATRLRRPTNPGRLE